MKQYIFVVALFLGIIASAFAQDSASPSVSPSLPSASPALSPVVSPTPSPEPSKAPGTVYDVIQTDPNFSNLKSALATSSSNPEVLALVQRLQDANTTTTFFAPNNKAFTTSNGTVTSTFLAYYLVDGSHASLSDGLLLSTLLELPSLGNQSQQVQVTKSGTDFKVNGGSTVEQTVAASNGQVYGINANLSLPADLWKIVQSTDSLSTLKSLVEAAGVQSAVAAPSITAFAPTNAAFAALPNYLVSFLVANSSESKAALTKVLSYHLGSEVFYFAKQAVNSSVSLTTVEGLTVTAAVGPAREYTVNAAQVETSDVLAENGAANIINKVLVPSDFVFTVANALVGLSATTDSLKAYVDALEKTGLLASLNNAASMYTVFAPSAIVGNASLASMQYTVVSGSLKAADLKDGQLLTTFSVTQGSLENKGQVLKVHVDDEKNVFVQGVKVTTADVGAGVVTNGLIHLLDGALPLPGSVAEVARATPSLSTLDSAVVLAGLSENLSGAGNLTVFGPTNDAFSALPASVLGYLVSNSSKESNAALAHVLLYHVYNKNVLYYNLGQGNLKPGTLTMLAGGDVTVSDATVDNRTVVEVNEAVVVLPDVPASNGVVHEIDHVLVPHDLNVTNVDLLVGLRDSTLIDTLNRTGLLANLTQLEVTIFAPTNAAFDKLKNKNVLTKSDTSDLKDLLLSHVVNATVSPSDLGNNKTYTALNGDKLIIKASGKSFTVNIVGASTPSGTINLAASSSSLGMTTLSYVYSIDQVLGEKDEESSGLTSTEIGLIVAGCIVGVLLAGAAVGGAVWYYKRRHGYEQIDGDAY